MRLVLDASVAIAGLSPDERHPGSLAILKAVYRDGADAPAIWPFEIFNILMAKQRRGAFSLATQSALTTVIELLPVVVHAPPATSAFAALTALATAHRLTIYDASYLALALAFDLPLATLDADLRDAAVAERVKVLP